MAIDTIREYCYLWFHNWGRWHQSPQNHLKQERECKRCGLARSKYVWGRG